MKFDGSHGGLLFAGFNQDYSRLTVGTKSGYRIYNVDPFRQLFSDKDSANIVQMLFNTSLVAHVGAGSEADSSQRCLRMINTKRKKEIIRMNYRTTVLAVKLNRSRLVLVLEKDIYIYDITNMKLVHVINATPENKNGVCALASCHVPGAETTDGCLNLLAYPGSDVKGNVYLYDTVNLRLMHMIEAHQSVVSCLEFNNRGDLLATASEKGTVFRVFRTPKGEKLFELRRGFKTFANVSSMCFSADSRFISVSSDKATIHVFKLEEPKPADTSSWTGYVTNGLGTVASYLPTSVTEVWTQARSFAMVQLPTPVPNLAALIGTGPVPVLLLVTEEGNLYRYKIPLEGGECVPDGSHRLDDYSQPSEGEGEGAAAAAAAAAAATAGGAGGVGGGVGAAEEAAEDKAAATFAEAVSSTAAKAEAGGDA